jgi:hypothetical protein
LFFLRPWTGRCEIHYQADIGRGLRVLHPTLGVVISPRGLAMLERSVQAVRAMIDQVPELAVARPLFERALTAATGTPQPTLDALGMARDRGLAVFWHHRNIVVILPVKERAKFVAAVHGSSTATGDAVLGWVCKPIEQRYVCASDAALWDQLGRDGLASVRASLEVRGDLEFAATQLEDMGSAGVAACARLETGRWCGRAWRRSRPSSRSRDALPSPNRHPIRHRPARSAGSVRCPLRHPSQQPLTQAEPQMAAIRAQSSTPARRPIRRIRARRHRPRSIHRARRRRSSLSCLSARTPLATGS